MQVALRDGSNDGTDRIGKPARPVDTSARHSGRIRLPLALALAVAAVVLAACSSSPSTSATSTTSASGTPGAGHTATITIRNFAFSPATLTVAPGTVVKVFNEDMVTHTLTASKGQFNTGDIAAGQSKTFTAPTVEGTYAYLCAIHTYMNGTLVVS